VAPPHAEFGGAAVEELLEGVLSGKVATVPLQVRFVGSWSGCCLALGVGTWRVAVECSFHKAGLAGWIDFVLKSAIISPP